MFILPDDSIKIIKLIPDDILKDTKLDYLISRLSLKEKFQLDSFPFQNEKTQHVLTRNLLRVMFSKFYDRSFASFEFETDDKGKSSVVTLAQEPQIYFNLSHTKGMITCAFSKSKFVGIDVELTTRDINFIDFADSIFSQEESRQLKSLLKNDSRKLFFKIWTLKEAYLKSLGIGIVNNLNEISFDVTGSNIHMTRSPNFLDQSNDWHWYLENPSCDHQLALAYRAEHPLTINSEILPQLD